MSQTFVAAQNLISSWEARPEQFFVALRLLGFEQEYESGTEHSLEDVVVFYHNQRLTVENWTDLRVRDWIADAIDVLSEFDNDKKLPSISQCQIRRQGDELFFDCPGGKLYARKYV